MVPPSGRRRVLHAVADKGDGTVELSSERLYVVPGYCSRADLEGHDSRWLTPADQES